MPLPYEDYRFRPDQSPYVELMYKASDLQKRVDELEQLTDVREASGHIQRLTERCEMLERHLIEAEAEIIALRRERDEAKEELRIWFASLPNANH